jgi:hypothetical protein
MRSSIIAAAAAALGELVDLKSIGVAPEPLEKIAADIAEIERFLRATHGPSAEPPEDAGRVPSPRAGLLVETADEHGGPTPAEIRIISEGGAGETNILREQTGPAGRLETALEADREYRIEIRKGFEYPIRSETVRLRAGERGRIAHTLARGVDLGAMGWHGGDLHHHSFFSDGADSPYDVYTSMLAAGLSFGALSDHNCTEQQKLWDTYKTDSFLPVLSNEISTGYGHVMNMSPSLESSMGNPVSFEGFGEAGTDASVLCDHSAVKRLGEAFLRLTDGIRAAGGISQLNHPVDVTENTSFPRQLYGGIGMFDCYELLNSGSPTIKGFPNEEGIGLWFELMSKGVFIPASAGSDNHNNRQYEFTGEMRYFHALAQAFPAMDRWPAHLQNTGRFLKALYENLFPMIEKWMLEGMGTGSSRVYAHTGKPVSVLNAPELFGALKSGRSFVTGGPILLPEVNGKMPGETVCAGRACIPISHFPHSAY